MDLIELPGNLQQMVQDELKGKERVVWLAQPRPQPGFSWLCLTPVLFAIPWTAFAVFWMVMASGVFDNGAAGPVDRFRFVFALFGVPFVGVGIAMLSSPIWIKRRLKRTAAETVYVVSEDRAIVFDGGYYGDGGMTSMLVSFSGKLFRGLRVRSYSPGEITNIERVQRTDGTGDVLFGEPIATIASNETSGQEIRPAMRAGFFSIENVKQVEDLLRALAANA